MRKGQRTCEIGGAEIGQDLQSQDADDCNDEPSREHEQDQCLFALVQLQLRDDWHGQGQHDDIEDDVEGSRSPSLSVNVVTFARMFAVPVVPCKSNRLTLEHRNQQECDAIACACGHGSEASVAEPDLREYAQVEEEYRYLH